MSSESKSSLWGTVGWWMLLGMGIAFLPYAFVFAKGDFEEYKYLTATWIQGNYDTAGLNILHHLRAWQVHAAAAIVFLIMGPFQFSPSFRAKFRTTHRVFGYAFVISGFICSFSALTVLIPNTEFGPAAQKVWVFQALLLFFFILVAVKLAREKKFEAHREYMIRATAIGYAVIAVRPFTFVLTAAGMSVSLAMEMSGVSAPFFCLGLGELYIRTVLLKSKTGQEIGESGSTSEPVNGHRPSGNNRGGSPPSASVTWQGRPNYRSAGAAVLVTFPSQRTTRLVAKDAARYDRALFVQAPTERKSVQSSCCVLQGRPGFANRTFRVSRPRSLSNPNLVRHPIKNVLFKQPVLAAF